MAKIILTHDVPKLGATGDVVTVKDGYARNYLLPRKLATPWTKGAQRQIDQMTAARRAREIATVEDARALRDALVDVTVTIEARQATGGRLFGAVSTEQIAQAVQAATGKKIDRRKIVIAKPIKAIGDYQVTVRLHADVEATVNVKVPLQRKK